MRDLLNSTLPRHFLSDLDEEYGIIDVSPILDAFYLPAAVVLDAAGAECWFPHRTEPVRRIISIEN